MKPGRIVRSLATSAAVLGVAAGVISCSAAEEGEAGKPRVWLGVLLGEAVDGGIQLVALAPDGPAAQGGLRAGDVLLSAEDLPVTRPEDLENVLVRLAPGDALRLKLLRSGRRVEKVLRVGAPVVWAVVPPPPPPALPPEPRAPAPAPGLSGMPTGSEGSGLLVADITPDLRRHYGAPADAGVLITRVERGQAGEASGIRVGDVLVRVDGRPARSATEVGAWLQSAGRPQAVELIRKGQGQSLVLRPSAMAEPHERTPPPARDAPPPGGPDPPSATPAGTLRLEQSIEQEILRLEQRIEVLQRQLEQLRSRP